MVTTGNVYPDLHTLYKPILDQYPPSTQQYLEVKMFRLGWAKKNDDNINFLGSNLIGVYPIRFTESDDNRILGIIGQQKEALQEEIYKVKGVNKNFKVITNVIYVTMMYMAHAYINSNLPKDTVTDMIKECYFISIYRMVCSLTVQYFRYQNDIATAKAVVEKMTDKYLLKKYGTWQEVFNFKCQDLLPGGIRYEQLKRCTVDDLNRILSDIQTKIRDIFKNTYLILLEIKKNKQKISSSESTTLDSEGEKKLVDVTYRPDMYINYLKLIIGSPSDLISQPLLELVVNQVKVVPYNQAVTFLNHYSKLPKDKLNKAIDTIVVFSLNYLIRRNVTNDFHKNLYTILTTLLGYWKSSNIRETEIKNVKAYLNREWYRCLKDTTHIVNGTVLTIVYLVLRALKYTN